MHPGRVNGSSVKGFHCRKSSVSKQQTSSGRCLFTPLLLSAVIATATLVLSFSVDRHSQASSSSGTGITATTTAAFVIPVSTKHTHGHNSITMSSSNSHFHHSGNQQLQEEDQKILPTPTKRNGQGHSTSTSPTSVLMMMSGSTAETDGSGPCGDNRNDSSLSKMSLVGPNNVTNPRSCILQVGVYAGQLCSLANTNDDGMFSVNNDGRTGESPNSLMGDDENDTAMMTRLQEFVDCLAMLTYSLWLVSKSLNLHLEQSIQNKLHLNSIKYPVEHCKGKAGKYTEYSHLTGITKTNQSTMKSSPVDRNVQNSTTKTDAATKPAAFSGEANETPEVAADRIHTVQPFEEFIEQLPTLAAQIDVFATERQWAQYHTPRNLVMALLGEVGELSEILQFHGDPDGSCEPQFLDIPTKTLDKLSQEIADVTIYMLRLVTVCDVVEALHRTLKRQSSVQSDD